ncbi:hypothetical protein H9P43_008877 [Blastocladiella emersonii ATCC 22665]|nr:hypothetical protein H9P43_008877 [Blastocladiella emersonii ATCC 22665]
MPCPINRIDLQQSPHTHPRGLDSGGDLPGLARERKLTINSHDHGHGHGHGYGGHGGGHSHPSSPGLAHAHGSAPSDFDLSGPDHDGMPGGGTGAAAHAAAAYHPDQEQRDIVSTWRDSMDSSVRRIFENLRLDIDRMEVNIKQAEGEIFRQEEEIFFVRQDEIELDQMQKRQTDELKRADDVYQAMLDERKTRKHTKKLQSQIHKEAKARHLKMTYQDEAKHMALQLRNTLAQHRKRFEFLITHIEAKHDRQRAQLRAAQDRKLNEQRALLEIETKGLTEEVRAEVFKDFAYRMNHQSAVDKQVSEQLRDVQRLELKHRKERFDAEAKALEEVAFLRAAHHRIINELETKHRFDYAAEKERIDEAREKIKLLQLEITHLAELKSLRALHKVQLAQAARTQRVASALRLKKWRDVLNPEAGDEDASDVHGALGAVSLSNVGSQAALHHAEDATASSSDSLHDDQPFHAGQHAHGHGAAHGGMGGGMMGGYGDEETSSIPETVRDNSNSDAATKALLEDQAKAKDTLEKMVEQLKHQLARQKEELKRVQRELGDDQRRVEQSIKARMDELDLQQDTEMRSTRKSHESAVADMIAMQQREYQMDANIRVTERKMLTERRTLNSILDAVYDAIVNIRPDGIITRFNSAAEKIFGYKAEEVIGKNVRMLTPEEVSRKHDGYLTKYLTTGVKSKAWNGISNSGRRKDGSLFPIILSVSEVKEEDFHLFTGVVRDVTEKQRNEELARAEQERKESEMEALISLLDVERTKSQSLIKEILPESIAAQLMRGEAVVPRTYPDATVLYTDLVGFTAISSAARPLDVVDMLNDLYSSFDEIIEQYDVYKVETIGDSYMVASGVPRPNGNKHLTEMAKLAIHLVKAISTVKIRHLPDVTLRMRIGIHTGPVVAGVVGRKMPRYCLFGDTVSIASKMESSGVPMKIQVSETTHDRLDALGGFNFEARGEMNIPGKGMVRTYFLTGCDGFNPVLAPVEESVGSPLSALALSNLKIDQPESQDDGRNLFVSDGASSSSSSSRPQSGI